MKNKKHNTGSAIPLLILIIAILLISLTATSMVTSNISTTKGDVDEYLDDVLNEITSYVKIKNVYGQYTQQKPYYITKIGILLSPRFHDPINLSEWIIQLQTKETLTIYTFNNAAMKQEDHTIFTHPLWENISFNSFGIMSIIDKDDSLIQHYSLSDPSDLIFIVFNIPENSITKGDYTSIILTSGTSMKKTITFSAPIPTQQIVSLF